MEVLFLALSAWVSGFLCATSGGSGMILLPALMLITDDPLSAIGTAKLAIYLGSFPVSFGTYYRRKAIAPGKVAQFAGFYSVGGIVSVVSLSVMDKDAILLISIIALVFMPLLLELRQSGRLIPKGLKISTPPPWIGSLIAFTIGLYSGALPGSGLLVIAALSFTHPFCVKEAVVHKSFVQLLGMFIPMILMAKLLPILWAALPVLIVSEAIGSYIGARFTLQATRERLRRVFIVLCYSLIVVLLLRYFGALSF